MKTLSKSLFPLIMLALLIPLTSIGQEYTKKVNGKYSVNPNAQLVIKNKFGEVHCQNWNEPAISIQVTIIVNASSQERADKILNKITVNLTGTADKVEAITNIAEMGSNNAEFSVNYLVMMPKNIRLDLDNRFGETYIAEVEGSSKLEVEYGELEAQSFKNTGNVIVIKFSDAQIGYLEGAEVEVAYSEIQIDNGNSIKLNSSFSEVNMEGFKNYDIISKYDDLQIGDATSVTCQAKFTEVNVESISGAFSFNVEYGGLDIESIGSSFGSGKIINAFNDVNIGLKPDVTLSLDAEVEFGEVDYPSGKSKISTQEIDYVKNVYKGTIGTATSTENQLYIRSRNAGVDIDYND